MRATWSTISLWRWRDVSTLPAPVFTLVAWRGGTEPQRPFPARNSYFAGLHCYPWIIQKVHCVRMWVWSFKQKVSVDHAQWTCISFFSCLRSPRLEHWFWLPGFFCMPHHKNGAQPLMPLDGPSVSNLQLLRKRAIRRCIHSSVDLIRSIALIHRRILISKITAKGSLLFLLQNVCYGWWACSGIELLDANT